MRHDLCPPRRPQAWHRSAPRVGRRLRGVGREVCIALGLLAAALAASPASASDPDHPAVPQRGAGTAPPSAVAGQASPVPAVGTPVAQGAPRWGAGPVTQAGPLTGPAPAARSRWLSVTVTAYTASEAEGTLAGLTATGTRARPGTVAVDPSVIPLGSRLRITGVPGVYRAEDTGSGIRGAQVDVFMASRAEVLQFGRHSNVLVEILEP